MALDGVAGQIRNRVDRASESEFARGQFNKEPYRTVGTDTTPEQYELLRAVREAAFCRLAKSLSHSEQMGWLVGAVGIEPTTFGLKGRCSTTELRPWWHTP